MPAPGSSRRRSAPHHRRNRTRARWGPRSYRRQASRRSAPPNPAGQPLARAGRTHLLAGHKILYADSLGGYAHVFSATIATKQWVLPSRSSGSGAGVVETVMAVCVWFIPNMQYMLRRNGTSGSYYLPPAAPIQLTLTVFMHHTLTHCSLLRREPPTAT